MVPTHSKLTLLKLGIIRVVKGGKIVLHIIYCLTLDTSEHEKRAINTYARMIGVNQHCLRQVDIHSHLEGLEWREHMAGQRLTSKKPSADHITGYFL